MGTGPRRGIALIVVAASVVGVVGCGGSGDTTNFKIGGAMEPTITSGTEVTIDKSKTDPSVGDLILYNPPLNAENVMKPCTEYPVDDEGGVCVTQASDAWTEEESVHRVVAGPLDSVQMIDGHVLVKLHDEKAITDDPTPESGYQTEECEPSSVNVCDFPEIDVPPGFYFVVGDNRSGAIDSRQFGFVRQAWIMGTVTAADGESVALPDDIEEVRATDTQIVSAISDDLETKSNLTDATIAEYADQFAGVSEEGRPAAAAFLVSQVTDLQKHGYLQAGASDKLAAALGP